jgi:hypothetical protein
VDVVVVVVETVCSTVVVGVETVELGFVVV